jgi:hypothetical protein
VYQSHEHFLAVFASLSPLLTDIQLPDCTDDSNADSSGSGSSSEDASLQFDAAQTMKDVNRERYKLALFLTMSLFISILKQFQSAEWALYYGFVSVSLRLCS